MASHIHIQAAEHDGRQFPVVERDEYHAATAALVIQRCGGRVLHTARCPLDFQTCRRAAFEQTAQAHREAGT